ncbi:TPA: portal protein [Escherichia coli]|nr:portal protein [Escherichia coli]
MAEKKMTDWHRKVLCNFDNAWSATQDMREQIIEAQRFVRVSGAQWEGSTNAGYSFDEGRFEHYPRFELNKIARECDRIIGEYRQNRISVKFRPKDDKASEALAEKMNGKFRADYQETSGGEACDNAFDDAVTGGFGCFRMCADYEDEMDPSNEQRRISLLPVYDPATCVFFDQDSKQYDRSDAMWAMEMFSMTPKAFEAEYPDSIAASLSRDDTGTQYDWSTPDAIYVGRYYEVRIEKVKLTAWRNPVSGETAIYDEEQIKDIVDELTDGAFELIGERTVKKRRVYCGLLSGAEWLEEPKRIPGEHIPLIPVYGRRSFVDNQERIEGHAAKAMDAQRLENLMVSMIADNATQAGGDGIPVVDVDMIPGPLATHWAERNKKRPAFLPMVSLKNKNGDITAQAQVSSYTPPTQMPPALAGLLQYTGTAIQQITGASQLENMPSNVATDTVDSIFNRMDTQSYIYMDNMAKSMRRAGVVWLSMAREVYGSDTPMRIVNEDGSDDVALMTGEVVDRQTGQVIALNDLSQGNYEVTVDVGQSFATLRKYQQANAVYADEAAKLKNTRLKNVLMKGDLTPEVVNNMLFSKNKSEIKTLYNSVGRVGRAQMRNGIIGKAMEKSGGSPDQFLRQLNILQNQTGITFKGQDAAYLKGLKNYLQSTQQAAKAAVTTPTGQQTIPFIIGYGTAMNPATTGAAVSYGLLTRAYESEPFRNAMLRMANTPRGSTAFEKAMQQAQKAINALTQGAKSDALSE